MRGHRLVFAVLVGMTAGCGADGGVRVQGPAPNGSSHPVTVFVPDAMGNPLQRPRDIGLTEFTSVNRLRWSSWGGPNAEAVGDVSGTWCPDEPCGRHGYPAKLTLSGLTERGERAAYYSLAKVISSRLPADQVTELSEIHLPVPQN